MLTASRSLVIAAEHILRRNGGLLTRTTQRQFAIRTDTQDSDEDFKPKYKQEPVSDVAEQIKKDVSEHHVFVYMKGVPNAPQCGFSNAACRILDAYGVKYGSRNVLADPALREGVKKFTSWPTIPQVFIAGEFIGGSDILMSMHQNGELEKALETATNKK